MARSVSDTVKWAPGHVLEASDDHQLKFPDKRVRACNLVPKRLTLPYVHTRWDYSAGITRGGHERRVPGNVDWELAARQLFEETREVIPCS